jgi:hypothetical protein
MEIAVEMVRRLEVEGQFSEVDYAFDKVVFRLP